LKTKEERGRKKSFGFSVIPSEVFWESRGGREIGKVSDYETRRQDGAGDADRKKTLKNSAGSWLVSFTSKKRVKGELICAGESQGKVTAIETKAVSAIGTFRGRATSSTEEVGREEVKKQGKRDRLPYPHRGRTRICRITKEKERSSRTPARRKTGKGGKPFN